MNYDDIVRELQRTCLASLLNFPCSGTIVIIILSQHDYVLSCSDQLISV